MNSTLIPWLLPSLLAGVAFLPAQRQTTPTRAELEASFTELMSGCQMVGVYTLTGRDRAPAEESYTIAKVAKVKGDDWRFDAKIEYAGKSVTIPIVVQVKWAGDTPMIQVTDMAIPMLGTYSARVLVYGNEYAGTWSGKDYGGHMYGRIDKPKQDKQDKDGGTAWASWRGPSGNGTAAGKPPTEWSEEKNIEWKVPVPGLGISTPVVWNDHIYLTTAIKTDVDGKPPEHERPDQRGDGGNRGRGGGNRRRGGGGNRGRGGRRGGGGSRGGFGSASDKTSKIHEFALVALDRKTGEVAWQKTLRKQVPHERGHNTGSEASSSPVTDGEHIFVNFGSRGLYCLTMDGEVKWKKDLGLMFTHNQFGEGASPALYGDVMVLNWDHNGDSFIAAYSKSDGEELWKTARSQGTSWSTPLIVPADGKPQVIVTATGKSRSYDLATGEELWSIDGMTSNSIPSPNYADGVAYLMSGFRGSMLQAIELDGAAGDLAESDNLLWSYSGGTSYVPSALLHEGLIYFMRSNSGVMTCIDVDSGETVYEGQRLGMRTVYSSPVAANGLGYVTSREGITKVFKLGPKYEEVATNELDDTFDASMVILDDKIYLRGRESFYCIGKQ